MTAPTAAQREQLLDLLTHHRRPLTIAAGAVGLSPSEAHDIATDAGYPNMHRVRQALEQLRDPAKPAQSLPASRARAREGCSSCEVAGRACWLHGGVGKVLAEPERAVWRQAEAGTLQHLVLAGRALCAADDAGPWRTVAGVAKCTACLWHEKVLARHG